MAAIVGMGNVSRNPSAARKSSKNLSTWGLVIKRRSMRSAPAQKEPGVEERKMGARTLRKKVS